ncbi:hypothetical protein RRF57_008663 [Xylaria bambusicola]|uniref:Uncharacterized protein n=1 Tax=Xylaria bambusicola TaxID=326684 RepID=A0AAN7UI92_9PEZI
MPARSQSFAKLTATCMFAARLSTSIIGSLPAFVINMTGYAFCFTESRMQISGVKEESMIRRSPP